MTNIFKTAWKKVLAWLLKDSEILVPGICECGHNRSSHVKGKYNCRGMWPPDEELTEWCTCTCQVYIKDSEEDDGGGGDEPEPYSPSPDELEELYKK